MLLSASSAPPKPLANRWDWSSGDGRRATARSKALFYREQHLALVRNHIWERMTDPEVKAEVQAFASRANNLIRTMAAVVPVAYTRGATREVPRLSDRARKAFTAVVAESGIGRLASSINALCWLLGPVLVGPCLTNNGQQLRLEVILPTQDEVRLANPERLDAALWRTGDVWVELDGDAWRYFHDNGETARDPEYHAAGRCPLAIFRCDDYLLGWWGESMHAGLVDASLDVAYKHALGLWSRQNSANFLTVINADLPGIPAGQSIGHMAKPFVIHEPQNGTPVSVFNRSIDPAQYLKEMAAIVEVVASRYGVRPTIGANGSLTLEVSPDQLNLLRADQVPWLLAGEADLWPLICDVLRNSTHPLAGDLPSGDEVRGALVVSFPDLSSPELVQQRIAAMQAGLRHGLSSPSDLLLQGRPELTREEADAERARNLELYFREIEEITRRNIPAGETGAGLQSVAELQGRAGGQASGAVRLVAQENR